MCATPIDGLFMMSNLPHAAFNGTGGRTPIVLYTLKSRVDGASAHLSGRPAELGVSDDARDPVSLRLMDVRTFSGLEQTGWGNPSMKWAVENGRGA